MASGIPQGSVLGPLLFLLYVNDIPEVVHCTLKMFADDTKLYSSVTTPSDVSRLQSDLESLANWSATWQLPFNGAKCRVLHLGRINPGAQYVLSDTKLCDVQAERDLGILIDC